MYGYSKDAMIGQTLEMLAAPERNDMEFTFNAKKRAYHGESQLFEWWGQRKNGEVFPKEIQMNKATHFGKDVVVAIGRDISERKQLQQQLFQAQKMDSIGTLAGGIAHDFNNLLTGILGYTSLLKSGMDEDENLYRYVEVIEESGNRAAALTDQLLAFGRGGQYNVELARANKIVQDVIQLLERTIDKSIEITAELSSDDPVFEVDASQIHQTIMNLCLNARDAMPEGGKLTIATDIQEYTELPRPIKAELDRHSYVNIAISDTGHGIDEETQQKIFEPFFTTKDKGRGTGLGLAMVYGIITNHRGGIDIASEPEKGATFNIYIPLSNREPGDKDNGEIEEEIDYQWEGTALVIDDEPVSRELIGEQLNSVGFDLLYTENGKEGLEKFEEHKEKIQLVILDMIMPVMGGREAFDKIKSIDATTRIIVASGYSQHEQAQEVLKAQHTRFVQKPFKFSKLVQTIHELMSGKTSS